MLSNLSVIEGIFETKFQGRFFFVLKIFFRNFFFKIEGEFNFGENGEKPTEMEFPLKGAFYPRASLARAAFKRDFLDNHGGRRSIAGIKESFKGNAARARLARGF